MSEFSDDRGAGVLIDWNSPWLAPYRRVGERVARQIEIGVSVVDALNQALFEGRQGASGQPQCFVAQQSLPSGEPYEAFIARTGCVPTRENAHDLFNGLAWLVHPALKARLNALQVEQLERAGVGAVRGVVRDALTLFDENAAWLQAPASLIDALRRRDWPTLFVARRALWTEARLELFGHALLEKLLQPRKAITAHVWVVPCGDSDPAAWLAGHLDADSLVVRPWLPLPVLGVPGWWNSNRHPDFYDDEAVFRPPRQPLKTVGSTAQPQLGL